MSPEPIDIQPTRPEDAAWVRAFIQRQWHAPIIVAHDRIYHPDELPGFVAVAGGERVGFLSYDVQGDSLEIVTLDSLREGNGIGTALIAAARQAAERLGCLRVWLITTNDNLNALGFYQKRGFRLSRVDCGATDRARLLKPEIPLIGNYGIPIHDEIELEIRMAF